MTTTGNYAATLTKHPTYETIPGYWERHVAALTHPRTGAEVAMASLLKGWLVYADAHRERYESGIGEDYVLGRDWARIGYAIRGLLNGELGRIDAGAIDSLIVNTLAAEDCGEEAS